MMMPFKIWMLKVKLHEICNIINIIVEILPAFCNNPEVVALANKNVIKDYLHAFKNIEYADYCSTGDDRNYRIFERVLRLV